MGYTKIQKAEMLNFLIQTGFKKFSAYTLFKEKYPSFSRVTLDSWLEKDKSFIDACQLELQKQIDEAEQAHRHIRNGIGIEEDGNVIGWIEKPDRQAIENFLKKVERGKWGEPNQLNIEGSGISINWTFGTEPENK